jgi:hypothetical protein
MTYPEDIALAIVALCTAAVTGCAIGGAVALLFDRLRRRIASPRERKAAYVSIGVFGCGLVCLFYAAFIEVDRLTVTQLEVATPNLPMGKRFRIAQIADLHVDRPTKVLDRLPGVINGFEPDLLVFTGDALNGSEGMQLFHATVGKIHARYGRYGVRGNFEPPTHGHDSYGFVFDGGTIEELVGRGVTVAGGQVTLCGAPVGYGREIAHCLGENKMGVRVVAYHTPDLIEDLAPLGPDLYLAGHTHGGQVRLPLWGAVVTLSKFGKKYEMGRYKVGETTLYTSRGIGMEPSPAPRIRFLCPPEVVIIDLVGSQ